MLRKSVVNCLGCGSPIYGSFSIMRLQITHNQQRLLEAAKMLGFTSSSWRIGDAMEAPMHRKCFNFATRVWKLAFVTRALSPRRYAGELPHPPLSNDHDSRHLSQQLSSSVSNHLSLKQHRLTIGLNLRFPVSLMGCWWRTQSMSLPFFTIGLSSTLSVALVRIPGK